MFKTYEQILAELVADAKASTTISDFEEGSLGYSFFAVVARALFMVWFMLEQIFNLFFVSSSKGSFLERRCAERGVIRKQGTAASGKVVISRTSPAPVGALLPQGTLFATADGAVELTVLQDVQLAAGWTDTTVDVACIQSGVVGNLAPGTPLKVVGIQVVGVPANGVAVDPLGLSGGVDTESDADLRSRYLFTIQNPTNGGTAADYIVWAMEVQGVLHAIPLPLNRGPGTVDVVVSDGGIPSDVLVQSADSHIQSKRPVGADVKILKPTAHDISVTATITAASGYDSAVLADGVKNAVQTYLSEVPIGGVVRATGIIQSALKVPGVLDFAMTEPTTNVQLGPTELATVGALNIT